VKFINYNNFSNVDAGETVHKGHVKPMSDMWGKLSPNGCRLMMCPTCGLEEDRDVIAVRTYYTSTGGMWGLHPFTPKALP